MKVLGVTATYKTTVKPLYFVPARGW